MQSLRSAITAILSEPLPEEFHHGIASVQRIWWADGGDGVASELALKTMEVTGLPGHGNSGNLLIHGIEESLGNNDMVVWFNPPRKTEDALLRCRRKPEPRSCSLEMKRQTGTSKVLGFGARWFTWSSVGAS